jgi:CBS domain-containing protein
VTAQMDERLVPVVARMQLHGVRRVPVVSQERALLGILEADDLWEIFAEEVDRLEQVVLTKISKSAAREPKSRNTELLSPVGLKKKLPRKKKVEA